MNTQKTRGTVHANGAGLTVGPVAEGLLLALRHVEAARNELYTAIEQKIGEEYAEARMENDAPAWDAVFTIINNAVMEHVVEWSITNPATNVI